MSDDELIRGFTVGAFAVYGAYKLYQLASGSNNGGGDQPETNQPEAYQPNLHLPSIDDSPFYKQPVKVVDTLMDCKMAVAELRKHCRDFPVLGLDCEWNSWGTRQPVALLQLATHQGYCVLIRLSELDNIPSALEDLLSDPNIKKVGVEVGRDMQYLYDDYQLDGRGALDLRNLAKRCNVPMPHGLASLAAKTLGVRMDKQWQMSDWEAPQLTKAQIRYAANDARVAIDLFRNYAESLHPRPFLTSEKTWIHGVVKKL